MQYIYQLNSWPKFTWDNEQIAALLGPVRYRLGHLTGRMEALGFSLRTEAVLRTLTLDVLKSSEIEGVLLDPDQVRSSIARRLGMDVAGLKSTDRHVEGVVSMMMDATQAFKKPLTKQRLWGWHAALFPTGYSDLHKINVGKWRDDQHGPMRVVSGGVGKECVHFEAPEASKVDKEMAVFLDWFESFNEIDPVLKAGVAHLWFVTIHPFDDGNGRISRAVMDMQLARVDGSPQRFYSMSVQVRQERADYYNILERTQKVDSLNDFNGQSIDISDWLKWFLGCLGRALETTEVTLAAVFKKVRFWKKYPEATVNERQRIMLNKLLDGFDGKLTSSKWAKLAKCSQDTALRDILELVSKGCLKKESAGGRSTNYVLSL